MNNPTKRKIVLVSIGATRLINAEKETLRRNRCKEYKKNSNKAN